MDAIRHVTIRGRVQGVGYRAWVADVANRMDLEGWVRNRRDGSVEALFAGSSDDIDAIISLCRCGPALAHVVHVTDEAAGPDQLALRRDSGFAVLETV